MKNIVIVIVLSFLIALLLLLAQQPTGAQNVATATPTPYRSYLPLISYQCPGMVCEGRWCWCPTTMPTPAPR